MDHCIERYGVHNTYREVIGDYIQELGKLWLSGSVGISQEHFVSSLIRQKIYAAIDALPAIAQSSYADRLKELLSVLKNYQY